MAQTTLDQKLAQIRQAEAIRALYLQGMADRNRGINPCPVKSRLYSEYRRGYLLF